MRYLFCLLCALILLSAQAFGLTDSYTLDSTRLAHIEERIHASIIESGIDDAIVNATEKAVVVRYIQPTVRSDMDSLLAWIYIWTAAAIEHPDSETVTIIQYAEGTPLAMAEADTADIKSLAAKKMTFVGFGEKVRMESPPGGGFNPCPKNARVWAGECMCIEGFRVDGGKCIMDGFLPGLSRENMVFAGIFALLMSIPVMMMFFGVSVLAVLALLIYRFRVKSGHAYKSKDSL